MDVLVKVTKQMNRDALLVCGGNVDIKIWMNAHISASNGEDVSDVSGWTVVR